MTSVAAVTAPATVLAAPTVPAPAIGQEVAIAQARETDPAVAEALVIVQAAVTGQAPVAATGRGLVADSVLRRARAAAAAILHSPVAVVGAARCPRARAAI